MARLGRNSYGTSAVRLVKVVRRGDRHEIRDLTVDIALEGDFAQAHMAGDNSAVLPTDTLKNTVYAKAREEAIGELEAFATMLARHFLKASPAATVARVRIAEHPWRHLRVADREQRGTFERAGRERRMAEATVIREGSADVCGGLDDAFLLKTSNSAYEGFPSDRYTTLMETRDRLLATSLSARWRYVSETTAFGVIAKAIRMSLMETFAEHHSESTQHTLYTMAKAALDRCAEIDEISLRVPDKQHLVVDLTGFGLDNPSEVFIPIPEPYGLVQATVKR